MNASASEVLLQRARASSEPTSAAPVLAPDSTTTSPTSDTAGSSDTAGAPDTAQSLGAYGRRSAAAVDVLRTWRLAREIVRYSADLVIVAPAAHEPAGLRIIKDDRSVDLVLGYNGAVWMHRPWKQVLDARIGATRSLGTTRLLAARVVKAAHVHAMPTEESPAHLMAAQVIAHLESRPKAQVINAVGWIREGGGLRYDTGRSVRWLWGDVPLEQLESGPLPELPPGAWFWLALDSSRQVAKWWCQCPALASDRRHSA